MSDESKLEKEATNFAFATGNEDHLDVVRLCWEACAEYIKSALEAECEQSACLQALYKIIDSD